MKEAIILAGGLGTRLSKAVPGVQKCMAPVNGIPFLYYVLKYLRQFNIDRYIFSVGYLHETIEDFISAEFSELNSFFSVENEPLGTGGAIKKALRNAGSGHVLVLNGDTFFNVPLDQFEQKFTGLEAECLLALKPMQNFDRYGTVRLAESNRINAFQEKKFYTEGLINGGIYLLKSDLFQSNLYPEKFSFEKDYLEKKVSEGNIKGEIFDDYFIDIGIPEDYNRAQDELKQII